MRIGALAGALARVPVALVRSRACTGALARKWGARSARWSAPRAPYFSRESDKRAPRGSRERPGALGRRSRAPRGAGGALARVTGRSQVSWRQYRGARARSARSGTVRARGRSPAYRFFLGRSRAYRCARSPPKVRTGSFGGARERPGALAIVPVTSGLFSKVGTSTNRLCGALVHLCIG